MDKPNDLGPMDLKARNKWALFARVKDVMVARTNIPEAPWFTVEADDKRRSCLNCIRHLLSMIPCSVQFFVPNAHP